VNVYIGVEGDSMRFEVADSGIGIPEREQQNIFKEFFRANNAKMVRTHGTGLGLSIVKHIVQNQGGTIDFTSRENHGTTFTALIPFEPKRPQENEEDKEAS